MNDVPHIIGYRNIGTGDICALITRRAIIASSNNMGMSQILSVLKDSLSSCLIDSSISQS